MASADAQPDLLAGRAEAVEEQILQGRLTSALAMGDAALAWLRLLPALLQACASAQVLDQAIAALFQVQPHK